MKKKWSRMNLIGSCRSSRGFPTLGLVVVVVPLVDEDAAPDLGNAPVR